MFWLPRLWNAKLTAAPPPCPPASLDCSKAGAGLKPFVPQLQTTFVKCLSDPQKEARLLLALVLRFRNVGPASGIRQQLLLCSTRMRPFLLPTQAVAPCPFGILPCAGAAAGGAQPGRAHSHVHARRPAGCRWVPALNAGQSSALVL